MPSPTNYDKLFNQAQGNELIGVLRGIKTAIGKNIGEVTLTENGEYTAENLGYDSISDITVEVPNTYDVSDEGKVVNSGVLVSQSSTTKNANGTYDTTLNNQVVINVPNTYSASDEGKVVDNGALVAQTSQNISQNGTYDTTLKNEVVVSVSGGGGTLISKSITQNGTYNAIDDNADGYNSVTVNVSGGGDTDFTTTFAFKGTVVRGNNGSGSSSGNVSISHISKILLCLHIWCPDVTINGSVSISVNGFNYQILEYTSNTYTDEYHAVRCYELDLPNAMNITSLGYSFSGLSYNSASEYYGEMYVFDYGVVPTGYCNAIYNLAMTSNDYTDSQGYEFIVSASSVYDSNAQPYKAFDGELSSNVFDCWHPASGTPQWLQIQFPQKIIVKKFTIYNRPSYVEHPTAFTVQGSDDGSTWTDLTQVSWAATGKGLSLDVTVPASQNGYYYYRLYITEVTSSPYGVIGEIKFKEVEEPQ